MKKCRFSELDETRFKAGFFVSDVCEKFGISQRTWYHWKKNKHAPKWALIALKLLAGELDQLGWKGWYIERGVLYTRKHSANLYNWTPGQLAKERFLELHRNIYSVDMRTSANNESPRKPARSITRRFKPLPVPNTHRRANAP
jgi:hypothetical protein